jgi:hypothetical protein
MSIDTTLGFNVLLKLCDPTDHLPMPGRPEEWAYTVTAVGTITSKAAINRIDIFVFSFILISP